MAEMCRFTAWISERERTMLDDIAREYGTSVNYLVRVAVRQFLDLDVPDHNFAWQKITSPGPPRVVGPHSNQQ